MQKERTLGQKSTGNLLWSSGNCRPVYQFIIDNAIMDEVRNQQINLAVAFYDYQKAYDMVRHDWMMSVPVDGSTTESSKCYR